MNADDFDTEKFYLGTLCKRGHDWNGTGKSLKRWPGKNKKIPKGGRCIECEKNHSKNRDSREEYILLKKNKYRYNRKRESDKQWRIRNKTHSLEVHKIYRTKRREQWKHKPTRKIYKQKINHTIRIGVWRSLHEFNWQEYVGYTLEDLIKHLDKQFTKENGYTWKNYGEWHIDHKIPISIFNFEKPEDIDFKRCWSLDNLQPLWATENIIKSNKIEGHFQPSFIFG